MPLAQHRLSICNTKIFSPRVALGHERNDWECNLSVDINKRQHVLTAELIYHVEIIRQNKLRVTVGMPDTDPKDPPRKRLYTCMEGEAEPKPLVMLVDGPDIVDAGCPKTAALEPPCLALANKMWFISSKVVSYDASVHARLGHPHSPDQLICVLTVTHTHSSHGTEGLSFHEHPRSGTPLTILAWHPGLTLEYGLADRFESSPSACVSQ